MILLFVVFIPESVSFILYVADLVLRGRGMLRDFLKRLPIYFDLFCYGVYQPTFARICIDSFTHTVASALGGILVYCFFGLRFTRLEQRVEETMKDYLVAGPEKAMPGSVWARSPNPSFQCSISDALNGSLIGAGFRVKEFILTASHVAQASTSLKITGPKDTITVPATRFAHYDADLAILMLEPTESSRLGMSSAVLSSPAQGQAVAVSHQGLAAGGTLDFADTRAHVYFRGSTKGGCSGSPYFFGNFVYGLHLGNYTLNYGYNSSVLIAYLRKRKEFSPDALYNDLKNNPDEWEFEEAETWGSQFGCDVKASKKVRGVWQTQILDHEEYRDLMYAGKMTKQAKPRATIPYEAEGLAYDDSQSVFRPGVPVRDSQPRHPLTGAPCPRKRTLVVQDQPPLESVLKISPTEPPSLTPAQPRDRSPSICRGDPTWKGLSQGRKLRIALQGWKSCSPDGKLPPECESYLNSLTSNSKEPSKI